MLDQIYRRRSVRKYSSVEVKDNQIEEILKAGLLAPSARNQQAWHIVVVQNKDLIKQLSLVSPYAKCSKGASCVFVPCVDTKKVTSVDYFQQDLALLSENILLEIVNQNLGGVYLGIYPNQARTIAVHKTLKLSDDLVPFCLIPCGNMEKDENVAKDNFDMKKVTYLK